MVRNVSFSVVSLECSTGAASPSADDGTGLAMSRTGHAAPDPFRNRRSGNPLCAGNPSEGLAERSRGAARDPADKPSDILKDLP